MRSNYLILTLGLFVTGCAHEPVIPPAVSPPDPAPAVAASSVVESPTQAPSVGAAPELKGLNGTSFAEIPGAENVAPPTASRNARTSLAAKPSPFVERSAVEALDRIAFLFHVQNDGRGKKVSLATDDLFAPGSDTLDQTTTLRLEALAAALKNQGPHPIRLESFTDTLGDPQENLALSQRRASALRDYFLSQGVPADRMVAEGKGAAHPIATNATPDGRASNRRIEVVIE